MGWSVKMIFRFPFALNDWRIQQSHQLAAALILVEPDDAYINMVDLLGFREQTFKSGPLPRRMTPTMKKRTMSSA